MSEKKVRKVKAIGFVSGLIIVITLLLGWFMMSNALPPFLKSTQVVPSETENIKVYKNMKSTLGVAVYYPVFKGSQIQEEALLNTLLAQEAHKILDELSASTDGNKEKKPLIRADYEVYRPIEGIVSVKYTCHLLENDIETQYVRSFVIDLVNKKAIEKEGFIDEVGLKRISQQIRCLIREAEDTKELLFSKDILEKTKALQENFNNFVIMDDGFHFFVLDREYVVSLDKLAGHVPLDLKVEPLQPYYEIVKRYVNPTLPMVALTFDDGPHGTFTPMIIDKLLQVDGAATFYELGKRMKAHPEVVKKVIEAGSEIGNHSWDHSYLTKTKDLDLQFNEPQRTLVGLTEGHYEMKTFRPPYGALDDKSRDFSPFPFIFWSIDTLDWKTRNVDATVDAVMKQVKDGSIVLMHDIHLESKDAALIIIDKLLEQGYQLVTVSDMFAARGRTLDAGVAYNSAYK